MVVNQRIWDSPQRVHQRSCWWRGSTSVVSVASITISAVLMVNIPTASESASKHCLQDGQINFCHIPWSAASEHRGLQNEQNAFSNSISNFSLSDLWLAMDAWPPMTHGGGLSGYWVVVSSWSSSLLSALGLQGKARLTKVASRISFISNIREWERMCLRLRKVDC